jgi:hypothetical protein
LEKRKDLEIYKGQIENIQRSVITFQSFFVHPHDDGKKFFTSIERLRENGEGRYRSEKELEGEREFEKAKVEFRSRRREGDKESKK